MEWMNPLAARRENWKPGDIVETSILRFAVERQFHQGLVCGRVIAALHASDGEWHDWVGFESEFLFESGKWRRVVVTEESEGASESLHSEPLDRRDAV